MNHPNIVELHDFKETNNSEQKVEIVMEYCAGGDLHDYIKRQEESIPEDVVRRLFTQACLGVDHLHRNEIVH